MLWMRGYAQQGSLAFEEIRDVVLADIQLAAASQAGMIDVTATRFIGEGLVETMLKGGTSGVTYVAICRVTTTRGSSYSDRVLEDRALVTVKDDSEV